MGEPSGQGRSIRDRLDELYRRLRQSPRAHSPEEAFKELCDTLDAVEDEWSGLAKRSPPPAPSAADGRMYCPMDDFTIQCPDGGILA
jgi:hypothetical protein